MSEIHETIEKAHEGALAEGFNKRFALVIAVLAACCHRVKFNLTSNRLVARTRRR